MDRIDRTKDWSVQRQVLSAMLFLHETTPEDLASRLGEPLSIGQEYDNILCYNVSMKEWDLTLTFAERGSGYSLHDIMATRGEDGLLYSWKHVPIKLLRELASQLGAKDTGVKTRGYHRHD